MAEKAKYIVIEQMNGDQTELSNDDKIYGRDLKGLYTELHTVEKIPEVLERHGWVEHDTQIRYEPAEEWESPGEWQEAKQRIYARGVVRTMLVYEEVDDDE